MTGTNDPREHELIEAGESLGIEQAVEWHPRLLGLLGAERCLRLSLAATSRMDLAFLQWLEAARRGFAEAGLSLQVDDEQGAWGRARASAGLPEAGA